MNVDGVLVGLLLILVGTALCWTAWLGSQQRLPRNRWVGIRLRSTLRDDDSWVAAHEEAAGPLGIAGGIAATGGVGVLAVGLGDVLGTILVSVTAVGVGVFVVCAAWMGARAASRSDGG